MDKVDVRWSEEVPAPPWGHGKEPRFRRGFDHEGVEYTLYRRPPVGRVHRITLLAKAAGSDTSPYKVTKFTSKSADSGEILSRATDAVRSFIGTERHDRLQAIHARDTGEEMRRREADQARLAKVPVPDTDDIVEAMSEIQNDDSLTDKQKEERRIKWMREYNDRFPDDVITRPRFDSAMEAAGSYRRGGPESLKGGYAALAAEIKGRRRAKRRSSGSRRKNAGMKSSPGARAPGIKIVN